MSSILRSFPEKSSQHVSASSEYGVSESLASTSRHLHTGEYGVSDLQERRSSRVAFLLKEPPCVEVLAELIAIDPHSLGRSARIDYLSALERQSSWLQAAMQRAIVAVAGEEPSATDDVWKGIDDSEREDIATALRLSGTTAQTRIDIARTLVNHLPNTCSALASGEISPAHATVIARETATAIRDGLSSLAISTIEERALAHAEFHTPAQVANKVRTTLARIAPEEFEEITCRAHDTRRVSCYRESDGMSTIVAILPALDAQFIMAAIESVVFKDSQVISADNLNKGYESDPRTIDMKRADALTEIAKMYLESSECGVQEFTIERKTESSNFSDDEIFSGIIGNHVRQASAGDEVRQASAGDEVRQASATESSDRGGRSRRRPITVNVTIDLPTLLGLAENPGQLAGYGAIPASLARELAGDSRWRRFITDPQTGALLDYGRQTYEPPRPLVNFLLARDRTCRFPGCRAPARLSDLDHAQSWETGGGTSAQNLGVLCRRHHRLKTHGGWNLQSNMDGSCTWTSPEKKVYFVPARDAQEAV